MIDSGVSRTTERWLTVEREGRDAEAEVEFGLVVSALPRIAPAAELETRIWRATRRSRWRSRSFLMFRRAAAAAACCALLVAAFYVTVDLLAPFAARVLMRSITGIVRGFVWVTLAFGEGLDTWTFLARLGRAAAQAIATPAVTTTLIVIEVIGGLAFYALNRVLAREKEISQ